MNKNILVIALACLGVFLSIFIVYHKSNKIDGAEFAGRWELEEIYKDGVFVEYLMRGRGPETLDLGIKKYSTSNQYCSSSGDISFDGDKAVIDFVKVMTCSDRQPIPAFSLTSTPRVFEKKRNKLIVYSNYYYQNSQDLDPVEWNYVYRKQNSSKKFSLSKIIVFSVVILLLIIVYFVRRSKIEELLVKK